MSKRIRGIIAAFLVVAGVTTNIHASRSSVAYANKRGKVKNVIMLIADGMSTEGITLARHTTMASILEGAESVGKATGIIATSEITHATPADFTAHTNNRKYYNQILQQQINQDMEVVLGGGFNKPSDFTSEVSTDEFTAYYEDQVNNI